jgi:hypothetical protein
MGILDDYDDLNNTTCIEEARFYLRELSIEDTPALYQAWYDIFMEEFDQVDNSIKILYLNILKQEFPKYRIWLPSIIYNEMDNSTMYYTKGPELPYKKGDYPVLCFNDDLVEGAINLEIIDDVINVNIDAYVHNYLLYDNTKYSVGHIFKHTLFKIAPSIHDDVSKGLFRDHYYMISELLWILHCVSHDGALLKLTPKKITSKYSDIKYFIKNIIETKIKIGERE